jgi:hypothetical protein
MPLVETTAPSRVVSSRRRALRRRGCAVCRALCVALACRRLACAGLDGPRRRGPHRYRWCARPDAGECERTLIHPASFGGRAGEGDAEHATGESTVTLMAAGDGHAEQWDGLWALGWAGFRRGEFAFGSGAGGRDRSGALRRMTALAPQSSVSLARNLLGSAQPLRRRSERVAATGGGQAAFDAWAKRLAKAVPKPAPSPAPAASKSACGHGRDGDAAFDHGAERSLQAGPAPHVPELFACLRARSSRGAHASKPGPVHTFRSCSLPYARKIIEAGRLAQAGSAPHVPELFVRLLVNTFRNCSLRYSHASREAFTHAPPSTAHRPLVDVSSGDPHGARSPSLPKSGANPCPSRS